MCGICEAMIFGKYLRSFAISRIKYRYLNHDRKQHGCESSLCFVHGMIWWMTWSVFSLSQKINNHSILAINICTIIVVAVNNRPVSDTPCWKAMKLNCDSAEFNASGSPIWNCHTGEDIFPSPPWKNICVLSESTITSLNYLIERISQKLK